MRRMAQRTVLADRCVLPEIWTAFLRMALLAGFVDVQPCELRCGVITVHVMAAQTAHFPLQDRVRKGLACFAALHLMAGEADIGLCRRVPDKIRGRMMDVVTVRASHLIAGVCAGLPAETDVILVAGQAHTVLCFDRRARIRAEDYD